MYVCIYIYIYIYMIGYSTLIRVQKLNIKLQKE